MGLGQKLITPYQVKPKSHWSQTNTIFLQHIDSATLQLIVIPNYLVHIQHYFEFISFNNSKIKSEKNAFKYLHTT